MVVGQQDKNVLEEQYLAQIIAASESNSHTSVSLLDITIVWWF
jgi:hypothetical protein